MHHANHFYGHAHIMARFCGLAEVPRIWGYLQHGWNVVDGFAVGTEFAPGFPKFVWSHAVRRRGWAMGRRDYVVVGSPWAYLLELEDQAGWDARRPAREGTIVYPFHGWEGQSIVGSHQSFVDEIRANEPGPITICLYWNEFRDPEVRRAYEGAGFRVISHGYRGLHWRDTDVRFLDKQLAELRRHKKVVSNRLGSAIFYGASVGCDVGVYGDPMLLQSEDPVFGGNDRLRRLWPELHQVSCPSAQARQIARLELGQDLLLAAPEVREAFGWQDAPRDTTGEGVRTNEADLAGDEDVMGASDDIAVRSDAT